LFVNTMRKLGIHAQTLGTVLNLGTQADARGATQVIDRGGQAVARGSCLSQVLDRGAEAVARGAVPCASRVLDRGAQAVACGAARRASHVPDRVAQAGAQTAACGDATLPQQEKNTRQMSRRTEQILPASSAQRQGTPRGNVHSNSWRHGRRLATQTHDFFGRCFLSRCCAACACGIKPQRGHQRRRPVINMCARS